MQISFQFKAFQVFHFRDIVVRNRGGLCDTHPEVLAYIGERNLLLSEKENGARLLVTEGMPDRAL